MQRTALPQQQNDVGTGRRQGLKNQAIIQDTFWPVQGLLMDPLNCFLQTGLLQKCRESQSPSGGWQEKGG